MGVVVGAASTTATRPTAHAQPVDQGVPLAVVGLTS